MGWMTWDEYPDYEVSEEGDVRNIVTGKPVKVIRNGNSRTVHLKDEWGKWHSISLIRLMAEAFYGNGGKDEKPYFIDNNPLNLHIDNITWKKKKITHRESKVDILRDYAVRIVELDEIWYNARIMAEHKKYPIRSIQRCLEYPEYTFLGYHFELLDPKEAGYDS